MIPAELEKEAEQFAVGAIDFGFKVAEDHSPALLRGVEEMARVMADAQIGKYTPMLFAWLDTKIGFLKRYIAAKEQMAAAAVTTETAG